MTETIFLHKTLDCWLPSQLILTLKIGIDIKLFIFAHWGLKRISYFGEHIPPSRFDKVFAKGHFTVMRYLIIFTICWLPSQMRFEIQIIVNTMRFREDIACPILLISLAPNKHPPPFFI